MADFTFATLRLGKTSVEEIKRINSKTGGASTKPFPISVVCTQIPADLDAGVIVFIWLGSDNSKGMATEWKQGFKAIGRVTSVTRGEKYNDESTTEVEVFYVFPNAINRLDILRDAAADYYRCSSMPIIGLDDHSNQTIRMLESGELSDTNAFFSALNCVYGNFSKELLEIDPRFAPMFRPFDMKETDYEDAFKSWLAGVVKTNGTPYSENTRNQYMGTLKAVSGLFAGAIAPYTSIFEITHVATFDRALSAIKSDERYDAFNKARGNGSLSAGLDLYRRFLEERNPNDGVEYLSPAWFRLAAKKYAQVDTEANALYQQFQSLYAPEKLRTLSDDDLLGYIFLGVNDRSLCNALEFDAQYTQFGSIAGGTAYKYNLFYSRNEENWKTSFGEGGQRSVSQEEALEIGKQIRDALVAGADVIANHETLATVNDYNDLLNELNAVIPQYITKMWFLKYYHMMFPHILPNFYNEAWQKHILCNLNIVPSDAQFIRMGQINAFVNECGISNIVFSNIIFDSIGSPKTFYRIGTGDNGIYFGEWRQNNYIAIGWNELGDLTAAYQEDADSKAIITDALKSQWNYDNRLASRKYGEINSFYSAAADTTYAVAMAGQKILAIGLVTGGYFFDEGKEYGHCRPVRWLKVFEEGKTLPFESEGKLTTFYELKNSENICYLYSLLHGRDETTVSVTEENVEAQIRPISFATGLSSDQPRNRILFGAPGTGKSFTLNREKDDLLADGGECERVTFHPDYSYANFVGTYKPVPCKDSDGKDAITYSYVPGPFMRTYVKALQNSRTDAPKRQLPIRKHREERENGIASAVPFSHFSVDAVTFDISKTPIPL